MFFDVSGFDHGIHRRKGHFSRIAQGAPMPEHQPVSSALIAAIERPHCPNCRQNRMLLSKLEAGPPGFGYLRFECQECGRVETTVVESDPMASDALRWLAGELKPPT